MRWHRKAALFVLMLVASLVAVLISSGLMQPKATLANEAILQPAPTQPLGYYDYFGELLSPQQAKQLVRQQGLDPNTSGAYERIGAVQITQQLLRSGENIFLNRKIGDTFGIQAVLGFGKGLAIVQPELVAAIRNLRGQPTTNLRITLQQDLQLGSRQPYPKGSVIDTGLDVVRGASFPIGLTADGNFTCAVCHDVASKFSDRLKGVPNGDLNIPLLIALAPNSVAGFARLNLNPLDPQYQGNGKTILNSHNEFIKLPDPEIFETAFDDALLDVPFGHFESSSDRINNTTQIPTIFTFKTGPYFFDGQFAVGPFAGLSATANAVHSSESNLLAAAQLSSELINIDPEVYLGVVLQNAAEPSIRLPDGTPVKPSEWLRQIAPDPFRAELEDQIPAPGAGNYPNLNPSIFTYNGLIFSPNTSQNDIASGPFLFANNAMAAFQNSLVPPPNRTHQNLLALKSGSVRRGAKVFQQANCATCHTPPFFTDNRIHPIGEIKTNPARAQSRLNLSDSLGPPQLYTFNNPVPLPADAEVLDVPTKDVAASPTSLPNGLLPEGGYKTTSLRGLYLSAPYLHDGGAAVRAGALEMNSDGSFTVVDPSGLGLTGTLSQGKPADSSSSLRALLDRQLRAQVVAVNEAFPPLIRDNLDGTGHEFYVDREAGFTSAQQTDLINFLLALDDDPGRF